MQGCFDMVCAKCGAKIAWIGSPKAMPDCAKCGAVPSDETKQALGDLADVLERITTMDAHFDEGPKLKEAREFAGLSLKQAAKLLDIPAEQLARIEIDNERPDPKLADRMNVTYRIGR